MEKEELKESTEVDEQEKIELLETLEKAKSTQERVELFGKVMDTYGVDALVSLIPELGDAGSSIASSLYLLAEAKRMGFSIREYLKIVGYQSADALIGAVPVIGDIADYFFKANKRSAKIFAKHFERLKKEAYKKGVSQEEINAIENNNNKFIEIIKKQLILHKKVKKYISKK